MTFDALLAAAREHLCTDGADQAALEALVARVDDGALLWRVVREFPADEAARPFYERILALQPRDVEARTSLARLERNYQRDDAARAHLVEALRVAPDDTRVLWLQAALSEDVPERVALFRRIVALDPSDGEARKWLRKFGAA